jgi:F-type H+-transporting ATPase subunit O
MLRLGRGLSGAGRRMMSTAALPETPPTVMFGTAGRYANALYAAAAKKQSLLAVADDLALLKQTLETSPVLHNFCTDPSITRESKAKGMVELLTSAKADETTKNMVATLAEGGRMGDVYKVIDMYTELISAAKGEVNAVITSAEPLPAAEMQALTKTLDSFLVRARARPPRARRGAGGGDLRGR